MTLKLVAIAALTIATAGCAAMGDRAGSSSDMAQPSRTGGALAVLKTADGITVGQATASAVDGGIRIAVEGMGMPPGVHGAHVHTAGRCDGPDFTTAGGHWNPTMKQHGTQNPAGPHAGDLPNLAIAADGRGTLTMNLPAGTMAELLDADGAAFLIHAGPDDLKTDPAGNSGGRIACGIFIPS